MAIISRRCFLKPASLPEVDRERDHADGHHADDDPEGAWRVDERRIARYLEKERPYDCAGRVKSEGLGIALFERFIGDDPTTLIGLPLIRLVRMLEAEGFEVP